MRPDVYGELHADGRQILLVPSSGNVHDLKARGEVALITPLVNVTKPEPVGLTLPLSWPAVVQLAYTYGPRWKPGPALTEWIRAEAARRTKTGIDFDVL